VPVGGEILLAPYDTAREGVWRQGGAMWKDGHMGGKVYGAEQKSLTRGVDRKDDWETEAVLLFLGTILYKQQII
jgi:hypothetical protein